MYKLFLKPVFFLFSPEKIHNIVFLLIKTGSYIPIVMWIWRKLYSIEDVKLNRTVFGLNFKNPVGLAAGFDKDGKIYNELSCFGFGFIEIGTLTPKGQSGNPQPRLFRVPQDEALINRMGFNNQGVEDAIKRLKKRNNSIIIGGNIGKNKTTPNIKAFEDYKISFEALFPYVDYFVVNVSSPNTPNLRKLQDKKPLLKLLMCLQELNHQKNIRKPILLKISPDLTNEQLDDIIAIVKESKIDGVIATNTTINRSMLKSSKEEIKSIGPGGLSGKPINSRSTEVIRYLSTKSKKAFPIIGVGGIHSAEDALEKIRSGATLVQIYTGFIYEGPGLIKKINKAILNQE